MFHDVDFSVKAGEVLGVSGLMGAGRTEIMQAVFGNLPYDRGSIFINGKQAVIKNPLQAIEHGIGFITEDRKTEGLLLEESIEKKCIPDQSGAYFRQGQGGNQQGEGKKGWSQRP